jgi:hypothetical protein
MNHRDAQRSELPVFFLDVDPLDRVWLVAPAAQRFLDSVQKALHASFGLLDHRTAYPVDSGSAVVGFDQSPRCFQHVAPVDQAIQAVKPEPRFLFGLLAQFLSQLRELLREFDTSQFFRSRLIQSVLSSSYKLRVETQAPLLHDRYSLPRYYGPDRLPTIAGRAVMHSRTPLRGGPRTMSGLPSPCLIFPHALSPTTPEGSTTARVRCLVVDGRLRSSLAALPPSYLRNEAESGSLSLRLARLPPEAPPTELPLFTLIRLLVERTINKMNTFQFIRSAKFTWRTKGAKARRFTFGLKERKNVVHFDKF